MNDKQKIVVITGGARGIGHGLAQAFLAMNCKVVISGRNNLTVEQAVKHLAAENTSQGEICGIACDVRHYPDVVALWDFAILKYGKVDIWINNAGLGQPQSEIADLDPDLIQRIFATNCTGALYGCKVALSGMKKQGYGAIYNMEGLGSDGGIVKGMTAYGASKRALAYITDSAAREAAGTGIIVGALRPGMTATDLIIGEYSGKPDEWAKVRRIFNILSDKVETVTPWLAQQMLANQKNGRKLVWLTKLKTTKRFLTAPFVKRNIYPENLEN